ncbi:hypothetical protein [Ferviditalea candida]|uniref:Uncharacterized protein n=1 Tax=Ferviditalea candida TaxID=3108399 RepID=A0ABU5ZNF3_9BACL|nr:hypothetical protein [Paenibacillaceae bacterium T2]
MTGIVKVGRGSIIAILAPEWITNQNIMKHDHFAMIWPALQKDWKAVAEWYQRHKLAKEALLRQEKYPSDGTMLAGLEKE